MQDIKKRLFPGVPVQLPINGSDFLFMKSTPADVDVTLNESTIAMRSGDHIKFVKEDNEVYLTNRNEFPIDVVVTKGKGEYRRQIIEGQVTVFNGLLGANGEIRPDTRVDKNYSIRNYHTIVEPMVAGAGFSIWSGSQRANNSGAAIKDGVITFANNFKELIEFNVKSGLHRYRPGEYRLRDVNGVNLSSGSNSGINCVFYWNDVLCLTTINQHQNRIFFNFSGNFFNDTGYVMPFYMDGNSVDIIQRGDFLYVFMIGSGKLNIVNTKDWSYESHSIGGFRTATIIDDRIYLHLGSNEIRVLDLNSLDVIGEFTAVGKDGQAISISGFLVGYKGHIITNNRQSNMFYSRVYAIEIESRPRGFTGETRFQGKRTNILKALRKTIWDETDAKFYVEEIGGRLNASGELVKAVIMQSLGECPDDYMDHVYAVEIEGGDAISGSFQSLLRMGIEDNFQMTLPANVKLTVDEKLRNI